MTYLIHAPQLIMARKRSMLGLGSVNFKHLVKSLAALALVTFSGFAVSAEDLLKASNEKFILNLPVTVQDDDLLTPTQLLGSAPGSRHLRPDELHRYFEYLDGATDYARLETIGYTYEGRPLLNYIVTAPENWERLDAIESQRAALWNPSQPRPCTDDLPAVVYLGYSIHGNESSGSNAAPWVGYMLSCQNKDWLDSALKDLIIIIDPALNPDGLARFAHWSNTRRGKAPVSDPNSWEHQEPWPSGRTNHYWFDLNRDWLPLQHPESRARVKAFQRWRPNLLADFHEMGSNATYFFQPGVPTRTHPLTPKSNIELTGRLADFHAAALDQTGALYFTRESYDDFYYGKGSTYPDVQGAVGILFEQASSRGLVQDTVHGKLSFLNTIQNQLTTSFSTIRGGWEMRSDLLNHQRDFYEESLEMAHANDCKGWLINARHDKTRLNQFLQILLAHSIEVYSTQNLPTDLATEFYEEPAMWIPYNQPQYRLIQALTEIRTEFEESVFYDISAWNFLFSFGLKAREMETWDANWTAERLSFQSGQPDQEPDGEISNPSQPIYGWALDWRDSNTPKALYRILEAGYVAYAATESFEAVTANGSPEIHQAPAGTIVVLNRQQLPGARQFTSLPKENFPDFFRSLGIDIPTPIPLKSGLTPNGPDLGSATFKRLEIPRIGMWIESGVSSYSAGEIWKCLDFDYEMPVSLLSTSSLGSLDWDAYNVMILPPGSYSNVSASQVESLKSWVQKGGTLIASQGGAKWASDNKILEVKWDKMAEGSSVETETRRPFAEKGLNQALKLVRGAIFMAELDLTHPMAFGFEDKWLPVFRNSEQLMLPSTDIYANVSLYNSSPLLSGYISDGNLKKLAGTANVIADRVGSGSVIYFADNPNFRSFWKSTQRMTLNAIFFGSSF